MPLSTKIQSTVWSAVHEIENTMNIRYPRSFPTIEEVKAYIDTICAKHDFNYHLSEKLSLRPTDQHTVVHKIKDQVRYIVAARAHKHGEFYLDEPLPDRKVLRNAVEADITRVNLLIRTWPTEFFDADVAAKYVAGVCALDKFDYTYFEGVATDKFQGYVTFNTARHAYAAGRFELKVPRKGWQKNGKGKQSQAETQVTAEKALPKPDTLTGTIELDVQRINSSIPRAVWPPTFLDLNEARNFIQNYCYGSRFKYSGWPTLLIQRYRLFVHFNAAKYALAEGMFKVEQDVPEHKSVEHISGAGEDAHIAHLAHHDQDDNEVVDLLLPMDGTDQLVYGRLEDGVEGCETVGEDATVDRNSETTYTCSTPSSDTSDSSARTWSTALAEANKEEAASNSVVKKKNVVFDPFENLVAELQRGYFLKPVHARAY